MDLDAVLAGCSSNDNVVRKQAEQTITAAAKSPEILSQLMQRLQSAEQPQVSSVPLASCRSCAYLLAAAAGPAIRSDANTANACTHVLFDHMHLNRRLGRSSNYVIQINMLLQPMNCITNPSRVARHSSVQTEASGLAGSTGH